MSKSTEQSTIMGKAYEFACLCAIENIVSLKRPVEIVKNSSYEIAKNILKVSLIKIKKI